MLSKMSNISSNIRKRIVELYEVLWRRIKNELSVFMYISTIAHSRSIFVDSLLRRLSDRYKINLIQYLLVRENKMFMFGLIF